MAKKQTKTYRVYPCKNGSQILSPVSCAGASGKPAAKKQQASKPASAQSKPQPKPAPRSAKSAPVKKRSAAAVKPGKAPATPQFALQSSKTPARKSPERAAPKTVAGAAPPRRATQARYRIEKLKPPLNGCGYHVRVLRSHDGRRFYYCGEGRFVTGLREAREYIREQKQRERQHR